MLTRKLINALATAGILTTLGTAAAAQNWPARPIELSVWASAGGGTDTTNRFLAQAVEPILGVKVNVTNRTGGGGGVAMNHIWSQPRDGYSWLGASEAMQVVKVMKYHTTGTPDWRWYIVAGSPGAIAVKPDSRFKTVDDVVDALKRSPKSVKVSHCPIGCVWHMKALALGQAAGVEFNYIPYDGSAPAQIAALTGEVDAVVSGISEQAEFIRAGKLRPIGMIEMKPFTFPGVGEIAAVGAKYPDIQKIPARQWLGMAIPKNTPVDVITKIDAAFVKAMDDPKIKSLATERFYVLFGEYGDQAEKTLQAMENAMSWKLHELKIAETNPSTLGIPKP
ncbi:MAG: tripartite tricarboxylate transporter substrate binding protein [Alphaproteobacteria bacterium]|nr:tripartite tricarboxylate transporter substrate binding protein [Alphaproteobacteria bacterium]